MLKHLGVAVLTHGAKAAGTKLHLGLQQASALPGASGARSLSSSPCSSCAASRVRELLSEEFERDARGTAEAVSSLPEVPCRPP